LIFSEFGACFDGLKCYYEITNSVDAYDDAMASWAYWMYKSFGDHTTSGGAKEGMFREDGSLQELKVKAVSRTYIHAFAGEPVKIYFNTKDGTYTGSFIFDEKVTKPSEIYIYQKIHYPGGLVTKAYTEGMEDQGNWVFKPIGETNFMTIEYSGDTKLIHGKTVHVTVTQKHLEDVHNGSDKLVTWTVDTTGKSNLAKLSVLGDSSYTMKIYRRDGKELAHISVDKSPIDMEFHTADLIAAKAVIRKRGFFSWMMLSNSSE